MGPLTSWCVRRFPMLVARRDWAGTQAKGHREPKTRPLNLGSWKRGERERERERDKREKSKHLNERMPGETAHIVLLHSPSLKTFLQTALHSYLSWAQWSTQNHPSCPKFSKSSGKHTELRVKRCLTPQISLIAILSYIKAHLNFNLGYLLKIYIYIYLFTYLFLAASGLSCGMRASL